MTKNRASKFTRTPSISQPDTPPHSQNQHTKHAPPRPSTQPPRNTPRTAPSQPATSTHQSPSTDHERHQPPDARAGNPAATTTGQPALPPRDQHPHNPHQNSGKHQPLTGQTSTHSTPPGTLSARPQGREPRTQIPATGRNRRPRHGRCSMQ